MEVGVFPCAVLNPEKSVRTQGRMSNKESTKAAKVHSCNEAALAFLANDSHRHAKAIFTQQQVVQCKKYSMEVGVFPCVVLNPEQSVLTQGRMIRA